MIVFPSSPQEAARATGELRAGGTDLQDRRNRGISSGPLVDLRDVVGFDRMQLTPDGLRIGALTRIADLGRSEDVGARWRGLAEAASTLATPQIRAVATVGGNLLQRPRCWYFRNRELVCLKKGGEACLAREGDHFHHACFDRGPCLAPHPSTLATAFLAYDAQVETVDGRRRTLVELLGDGRDPRRENTLEPGAVVVAVIVPEPSAGERSAYFRATSRARSEWPAVEATVRIVTAGSVIREAHVAIGGVATIPLRLEAVEDQLVGQPPSQHLFEYAAAYASKGANPPPGSAWKVPLLAGTVATALERCL
jgi:xanthine dehydrogenase YagS FAD-binding subunit